MELAGILAYCRSKWPCLIAPQEEEVLHVDGPDTETVMSVSSRQTYYVALWGPGKRHLTHEFIPIIGSLVVPAHGCPPDIPKLFPFLGHVSS